MNIIKIVALCLFSTSFVLQSSSWEPVEVFFQRRNEILADIKKIEQNFPEKSLFNDQNDHILKLTDETTHEWSINVESQLENVKETVLGILLQRLVNNVEHELDQEVIGEPEEEALRALVIQEQYDMLNMYHIFFHDDQDNLVHLRFFDGEVREQGGKKYQCRNGRLLSEDDPEVTEISFEEYNQKFDK